MQEQISFTKNIKEELTSLDLSDDESKSLLAAFIRVSGILSFSSTGEKLTLKTENAGIAKYIYKLIKERYDFVVVSFSFVKVMKLYKATEYLINIVKGSKELLKDLNIDFLNSKIIYDLQNKEEKIRAYLIGTFLACGSCNNPSTSNYHLEFALSDDEYAASILKMINKIKNLQFNFKLIQRRNKTVVYLKRSDQISDFLAFINASNSCIEFENIRMDRDFANTTNRLMNCDSYNFKKTLDIANKQLEYINVIERCYGVDNLENVKLKTLCKLRMENPESNYNELASLLSKALETSVSKSNVNHLFMKIKQMAEEFDHDNRNN